MFCDLTMEKSRKVFSTGFRAEFVLSADIQRKIVSERGGGGVDRLKLICSKQTISRMTNYFAFGFYFHPHEARKS